MELLLNAPLKERDQFVPVAKKLIGCRHMYPDILKVFEEENIPISKEEVSNFF